MDVSSVEAWESFLAQHTPQEVGTFHEGIQAGINGEVVPLCAPCEDQDEPLDALFRKGKGKGKGKRCSRGGTGIGGAAADSGKSNQVGPANPRASQPLKGRSTQDKS